MIAIAEHYKHFILLFYCIYHMLITLYIDTHVRSGLREIALCYGIDTLVALVAYYAAFIVFSTAWLPFMALCGICVGLLPALALWRLCLGREFRHIALGVVFITIFSGILSYVVFIALVRYQAMIPQN